jgi:hypothetical protein
MGAFATGRRALGICDVCGWQYKLSILKPNIVKGRITQVLACPQCQDPDHPQLFVGEVPIEDPQALFNARPVSNLAVERAMKVPPLFVMGPLTGMIGRVQVVIT